MEDLIIFLTTIEWGTVIKNLTILVSIASVIAKLTPDETDNKLIAVIQKIIDIIAMSSKPTKYKK